MSSWNSIQHSLNLQCFTFTGLVGKNTLFHKKSHKKLLSIVLNTSPCDWGMPKNETTYQCTYGVHFSMCSFWYTYHSHFVKFITNSRYTKNSWFQLSEPATYFAPFRWSFPTEFVNVKFVRLLDLPPWVPPSKSSWMHRLKLFKAGASINSKLLKES